MTDELLRGLESSSSPPWSRLRRLAEYGLIGVTGIPIDLAVVAGVLEIGAHYLAAQALGWTIAMSWNFGLNWWVTFDQPEGAIWIQYLEYAVVQSGALGARGLIVLLLVERLAAPVLPASLLGIVIPALAGYLLAERWVFEVIGGD